MIAGLLTETQVLKVLAERLGTPRVDVDKYGFIRKPSTPADGSTTASDSGIDSNNSSRVSSGRNAEPSGRSVLHSALELMYTQGVVFVLCMHRLRPQILTGSCWPCRGLPLRSPLVSITRTLGGGGGSRQLDPVADRAVRRLRKWRKMLGMPHLIPMATHFGEPDGALCSNSRWSMRASSPPMSDHGFTGAGGQDWKSYLARSPRKVQRRVRKGIPDQLRGLAWQLISGGRTLLLQHEGALPSDCSPRTHRGYCTCSAW